ncbi:MAG: hypothetical protein WCC87_08915 [Candidatus Korobacteraceae bacterium]
MIYFQAVEEGRESANQAEIESLFRLAGVGVPKNLGQKLGYLCGRGAKLLPPNKGNYELRREVKREIGEEVRSMRGEFAPVVIDDNGPFEFKDRTFTDKKVAALLDELRRCYATQCWNACGLLMRIIIERTVDTVDPAVKAKSGLKDKLNKCREVKSLAKSVRESIDHLHSAKIIGDIAAHDSTIVVDEPDIHLALPHFRVLLKSVTTV